MLEFLEKKETKIAAMAIAVILVIIFVIMLFQQNTVKQTKNSLEHEAGEELVLEAKDFFAAEEDILAEMKIDASEVNANKVGEYEATATYKSKKYTIDVKVVDTTAPKVTFAHRYVFANDVANVDLSDMFESTLDASECTVKLVRFERKENLGVMDEKALKTLMDAINTYAKAEELQALGTTDIPTEEGVYRAVLEVADAHGNAIYEEIILVLDKTGAKIEDVADKTITVSTDKLSEEPTVDKSEYIITDNVDGKIAADDITCQLELRDEAKHEWLVHVSYVDRAGNESKASFLIIVKEGSTAQTGNGGSSNQGGNSGNGGSSNQGGNTNSDTNKKPVNNQDISTWEPSDYDENEINPAQQQLIDAGYGNVVDCGDGTYAVLVHKDLTAKGKNGRVILEEYLAERDLEIVKSFAGIIDEANDWYFYEVREVRELITPDEDEFWD